MQTRLVDAVEVHRMKERAIRLMHSNNRRQADGDHVARCIDASGLMDGGGNR